MWKVYYLHQCIGTGGGSYMVYRPFDSRKDADEFISVNAMVHPLPRCYMEDPDGNVVYGVKS
jgi:hypothetical protein